MACLRLFTLPPFPRLPLRSMPCLLRRIALVTVLLAPLMYFWPLDIFERDFFFVAISALPESAVSTQELFSTSNCFHFDAGA